METWDVRVAAWITTVALLFWGWISLNAICEWRAKHRARATAADENQPPTILHQWRWSLIQIARVIWPIGLVAGLL